MNQSINYSSYPQPSSFSLISPFSHFLSTSTMSHPLDSQYSLLFPSHLSNLFPALIHFRISNLHLLSETPPFPSSIIFLYPHALIPALTANLSLLNSSLTIYPDTLLVTPKTQLRKLFCNLSASSLSFHPTLPFNTSLLTIPVCQNAKPFYPSHS